MTRVKLKPITGYPGGKQRHAKQIVSKFPEAKTYKVYQEPFIGMGAVFLELQPSRAIISDIDPDVVNIWKRIRDNSSLLIRYIREYKIINSKSYNEILDHVKTKKSLNTKRAAYYLILLKHSYGNYIEKKNNTRSNINHSYIGHNRLLKQIENIKNISAFLKNNDITILNLDAKNIKTKQNQLIYFDPPYISNSTHKLAYHGKDTLFLELFEKIKQKNTNIFMSNTDLALPLLKKKYNVIYFESHNMFTKRKYNEVLIYK